MCWWILENICSRIKCILPNIAWIFMFEKVERLFEYGIRRHVSSPVCMNLIVTSCVIKDKLVKVSVPGFCRYNLEEIITGIFWSLLKEMKHSVMPSEWKLYKFSKCLVELYIVFKVNSYKVGLSLPGKNTQTWEYPLIWKSVL